MADDIVTRLRQHAEWLSATSTGEICAKAADEIERLRSAFALAVGELSTYGPMRYMSPEQLMQHFMEEARRG